MTEEEKGRIFAAFERLDNARDIGVRVGAGYCKQAGLWDARDSFRKKQT